MSNTSNIVNLKNTDVDQDAATKIYVDSRVNMGTSISNPYTTDIYIYIYIRQPNKLFYCTPPSTSTCSITNAILDINELRGIFIPQAGGTVTGAVGLVWDVNFRDICNVPGIDNTTDKRLSTIEYVETRLISRFTLATGSANFLQLSGLVSMTGNLQMCTKRITGLADPTDLQDAATKKYVDDRTTGAQSGNTTYLKQDG